MTALVNENLTARIIQLENENEYLKLKITFLESKNKI